jgi:iron complex transport system ATP-binding protein
VIDAGLDVASVTVRYGSRVALHEVSMVARPGTVVALAGPNGSGKSTLLRAAVGLEPTSAGAIRLDGGPVADLRLPERARRVAWMPQEEPAGDNLPVVDYVRYGRFPHVTPFVGDVPGGEQVVDLALEKAGIQELRDRPVWELSGGERQRVRFARVLAQEAPVLLLDEPTAHLDIAHQLDLLDRVRSLARVDRTAVVVALHDLNLAARFADRVVVLARGRLVAEGSPAETLSPRLLSEVWGIDAELRFDPASRLPYLIPRIPTPALAASGPGRRVGRPVHVVAGGGSGGPLLRRLVDAGCSVTAGVLPLFDSDAALAEELRIPTAREVPFAPISPETRGQLRAFLAGSEWIVAAAFPVGPANLANLEELALVADPHRILLLAQPADREWDFTGGRARTLRATLIGAGARELPDPEAVLRAITGDPGRS